MHYYQFHIADYRKDTVHLTPMEHYIYRQLIDWYYLDEQPIPRETQVVIRRLGLGSDGLSNLENVLNDFFKSTESGWVHSRIEDDLSYYKEKADKSRANGRKGGRPKKQRLTDDKKPRKTQPVILANPTLTQGKAKQTGWQPNQHPITNTQHPTPNTQEPFPAKQETSSSAKRKTKTNNHSSQSSVEDHELANFIWEKIDCLAAGQKKPNLATWANDLRKMRTLDGRTVEEIKDIFIWANTDSFWQSNIRSPKKLREQFDHLKIKRKSNGSGGDKSQDAWERARKEFLGESAGNVIDGEFSYD